MRLVKLGIGLSFAALLLSSSLLSAQSGQDLFKAKCAMCHGADAKANTPMGQRMGIKDLRAPEIQKQSDAELTQAILKGKGKMPPQESKVNKEQAAALVTYIRDLAKQK